MSDETRFDAVHVEATPTAAIDERRAAQLELLDQDEIVELSIRPSIWFIPLVSARASAIICASAVVVSLLIRDSSPQFHAYVLSLAIMGVVARTIMAAMQWASRVYVLTNRRVMRLSGMINVDIAERQLRRIGRTNLQFTSLQRTLGLGSIHMMPAEEQGATMVWEHVAKPADIYARLTRAIKKAQSR